MSTPEASAATPISDTDAEHLIDAMSAALALPLRDANRTEVRANLLVAHRMAGMIMDFALDDHEEALPVYRP